MRVRIYLILLCGLFLPGLKLIGQDIHFSQFFNSPLGLNPSQTGDFDGNWRVAANYRDQWTALNIPYKTMSASFDEAFPVDNNKFAGGLYVVNDQSALIKNKIYLSGSWSRELKGYALSGGLQLGYVMQKVDPHTFPQDYNYQTYNFETVSPGESSSYFDINIGFGAKRKIGRYDLEAGASIYHLNHPTESFSGSGPRLPLKYLVNLAARTDLVTNLYLKPRVLFGYMGGSKDIMLGSWAGYTVQGSRKIRELNAGVFVRNGLATNIDAFVLMGGVQIKNISITASYDMTVSTLSKYGKNYSSFELSLIYRNISAAFKIFSIPCERI